MQDQIDSLDFINNVISKLIRIELNNVGSLLPIVKQFLLQVPKAKPDIINWATSINKSVASVKKLQISSDVDFFTEMLRVITPPVPDAIKRGIIGVLAITPETQLKAFRSMLEQNDGTIITNALQKLFAELSEAIHAADVMSGSSSSQQPPSSSFTSKNANSSFTSKNANSSFTSKNATFGGYRRKSRKAKKSKKAKKTQRR
jgi:hypothetical protein